jgi:hypothetical protein
LVRVFILVHGVLLGYSSSNVEAERVWTLDFSRKRQRKRKDWMVLEGIEKVLVG